LFMLVSSLPAIFLSLGANQMLYPVKIKSAIVIVKRRLTLFPWQNLRTFFPPL